MPYRKMNNIKTFGDLVDFIQEWEIENCELSIQEDISFYGKEYKMTGCDVSYSSEGGTIYIKEVMKNENSN